MQWHRREGGHRTHPAGHKGAGDSLSVLQWGRGTLGWSFIFFKQFTKPLLSKYSFPSFIPKIFTKSCCLYFPILNVAPCLTVPWLSLIRMLPPGSLAPPWPHPWGAMKLKERLLLGLLATITGASLLILVKSAKQRKWRGKRLEPFFPFLLVTGGLLYFKFWFFLYIFGFFVKLTYQNA